MRAASTAFQAALRQSHRLATRVEILRDGAVIDTIDDAIDGTVTLDINAVVRGRADLTIADDGTRGRVPTRASSPLAPYGNEFRVSRGLVLPGGASELVPLGVFRIDDANVSDTGPELAVRLTGQDRSVRVVDARAENAYQVPAGTLYTDAIKAIITGAVGVAAAFDFAATSLRTPLLNVTEGDDQWALAQEMAGSLGCVLYADGDGVFVLRPVAQVGSVVEAGRFAEGEDGLLLTAGRSWSRQGSFNRIIVTGENTGEGAPVRAVATDENPLSPTYYYGPFGRVPRFYTSQFILTTEQAQDAANGMLARELGTTQKVSFGSLVDPTLEPNDVVQITRARAGLDEQHVIDSLTIPLGAEGTMTGTTRAVVVTS